MGGEGAGSREVAEASHSSPKLQAGPAPRQGGSQPTFPGQLPGFSPQSWQDLDRLSRSPAFPEGLPATKPTSGKQRAFYFPPSRLLSCVT